MKRKRGNRYRRRVARQYRRNHPKLSLYQSLDALIQSVCDDSFRRWKSSFRFALEEA